MKNVINCGWLVTTKAFLLLIFMASLACGFSKSTLNSNSCSAPFNITKTGQTSDTASFIWDSLEEGASFKVWYQKEGEINPGPETIISSQNVTISNLTPGNYTVFFVTICGTGESGYVIYDDLIMG